MLFEAKDYAFFLLCNNSSSFLSTPRVELPWGLTKTLTSGLWVDKLRTVISFYNAGNVDSARFTLCLNLCVPVSAQAFIGGRHLPTLDCSSQHAGILTLLSGLGEAPGTLTHSLLFSRRKRKEPVYCWGDINTFKGLGAK